MSEKAEDVVLSLATWQDLAIPRLGLATGLIQVTDSRHGSTSRSGIWQRVGNSVDPLSQGAEIMVVKTYMSNLSKLSAVNLSLPS